MNLCFINFECVCVCLGKPVRTCMYVYIFFAIDMPLFILL